MIFLDNLNLAVFVIMVFLAWLYLAHLPLLIVGQALVRNWPVPALLKFTLLLALATAGLLADLKERGMLAQITHEEELSTHLSSGN